MKQGTPFISSLEMRKFDSLLYPAVSSEQTLALSFRYNMGPTDGKIIRPAIAMVGIKRIYNVKMAGWEGDPCAPLGDIWDRVGCTSVNNSLRITYMNLVRLVGYCMETRLGLVYEYMSQGCLADHLRGLGASITILNWQERLQIALDAAQGLVYLHTGYDPPIIHGDVKSSNILLDHNLRAKIAGLGISRAFHY
ncbi:hypothetical protein LUZ60_013593 [Juncus effusus]|nr:hypothetical protein LUZ60_013593 [Juncus effusus]